MKLKHKFIAIVFLLLLTLSSQLIAGNFDFLGNKKSSNMILSFVVVLDVMFGVFLFYEKFKWHRPAR